MSADSTHIVYYSGAYGNTIRIATRSRCWLIMLKDVLTEILDGKYDTVDICQLKDVAIHKSINGLVLSRTRKSTKPCVFCEIFNGDRLFQWEQDVEEIMTLSGLIEGLTRDETPSHQYLAYEDDGCTIELSYNEYDMSAIQ